MSRIVITASSFFVSSFVLAISCFAQGKSSQQDFIISGNKGHGTQECLSSQGRCGKTAVDSFCKNKGFSAALAYRQLDRDEITGSTGDNEVEDNNFLVSCR